MTVPDAITRFETLLASGKDGALLRFTLGNEYLKSGDAPRAVDHLRRAVELDAKYSAAWKLLGKALTAAGRDADALAAFQRGMVVAEEQGDKQAMREMKVFAQRLAKQKSQE